MNNTKSHPAFRKLRHRYLSLRLLEITFLALATFFFTYGFVSLSGVTSFPNLLLSLCAAVGVSVLLAAYHKLHKLGDVQIAHYLNGRYSQLKESADLLLRNEMELVPLQQLQRVETTRRFDALYPSIKFPHHLSQASGILVVCLLVYFGLTSFSSLPRAASTTYEIPIASNSQPKQEGNINVSLQSIHITIDPPRYTLIRSSISTNPHLVFPEGSRVNWMAKFTGEVKNVKIIFSGKDSAELITSDGSFAMQKQVTESGFYQLQWTDSQATHRSDYYQIEVIEDKSPKVEITNLPQFTKLALADNLSIEVLASLRDDYGIKDADVVATVSKGSGESVKFREEKIRFSSPASITGKNIVSSLELNLIKLGLEPGDELYFYVQALDNKTPVPNYSRTETFFISLQDTTSEITSADDGLGVDLMPEYFRSQRQIIIDTEKLLREKKKLSRQTFNFTSNELGYDQKVLRLRYGQFLGEEADSGIGQQTTTQSTEVQEDEKDKDPSKEFGHKHDTDNEHNLVETKKDHDHEGEVKDPEEKEDPMKEFMHSHDNTEEGTFFIQTVKAKLKAALTLMWDAELYLRLYEPAKSLPYQYKILNLLKEISNDSRIYVHRTGFDPPPLKEDKRLTADLSEVKMSLSQHNLIASAKYPHIQQALVFIGQMQAAGQTTLPTESHAILNKAGQELASIAVEQPLVHLRALSLLKSLVDQKVKEEDMTSILNEVSLALWKVLPTPSASPTRPLSTTNPLEQKFLKSLEEIKNE